MQISEKNSGPSDFLCMGWYGDSSISAELTRASFKGRQIDVTQKQNRGIMQSFGDPVDDDDTRSETYEIIGRLALGYLNGVLLGEDPSIEDYVQRASEDDQPRVRQILEEVVAPLSQLPGVKPGHLQ